MEVLKQKAPLSAISTQKYHLCKLNNHMIYQANLTLKHDPIRIKRPMMTMKTKDTQCVGRTPFNCGT